MTDAGLIASVAAPGSDVEPRRKYYGITLFRRRLERCRGARHLVRSPVFTVGAVAILAIGIGANTTVFTVVDTLMFRAPPWSNPDQVVHVYQDSDDGEPSSSSFPATWDMAGSDVFAAGAATTPRNAAWDGPDGPQEVATEYTTSPWC